MRVLVTGARGFVGGHVCAALMDDGMAVRGLVRPGGAPLAGAIETAVAADLTDRAAVRRAVQGVDAVVHLAARVHVMKDTAADPLAEFRRVNVEGTRVLMEEAAAAGARAFVYASSVKAVGESSGSGVWTEQTEPRPVDPYGISKLEAERLVCAVGIERRVAATILRFPMVYGPGVSANMLALMRLIDRGVPLPFGGIRNRRSLAFVGNIGAAVAAVVKRPALGGQTFFVSDGRDVSTPELVRLIAGAMGRQARLIPVPPSIFRASGRAGDLIRAIVPFPIHSGVVDRLLGSLAIDSTRFRVMAAFEPPFTIEGGIALTAEWYRRVLGKRLR